MTDVENKKLEQAMLVIAQLMADNGLSKWTVKLNNKRASLAETWHSQKTITFSKYFILAADKSQVVGVTLHEVTHAILGAGHGHDKLFVEKCTEISPNADYAKYATSMPLRKYILTCPRCGQSGSNNKNEVRYCGKCFAKDESMVKFDIKENNLKVVLW